MTDWRGKRVVVVGLARQGKVLTRHFAAAGARVVVTDLQPATALGPAMDELEGLPVTYVLGGHPPALLEETDLLCLSGGVPADLPLAQQARELGIAVTNDSQLLLEDCPAPVVGITGSAGKSTTTALLGAMAEADEHASGRRAWVGGNIGRPLLLDLPNILPDDRVVIELSSFQLEIMTASPAVAVVLNITPNHLDRHRTMEAYTSAKARILAFQSSEDTAVLGWEDEGAWNLRYSVHGRLVGFGRKPRPPVPGAYFDDGHIVVDVSGTPEPVCRAEDVPLRGEHNLLNALAACAAAASVGLGTAAMAEGLRVFHGLPHRLEFIRRVGGAEWYDDSIATTPERSLAGLRSFTEPIVLLAGGRDKDLPWGEFAEAIRSRVDHLVLFGEAVPKIQAALAATKGERPYSIDVVPDLESAVEAAARRVQPGDVVLLSPGGTSFDAFMDFAARGDRFRELVEGL
ncbi:MAG TPA: UDP-N-acetylmuramoyl-L-alanine--D-glutamate ligase [Anaerolineales bacterium]|nr:UDP-N-acetylmuramoyl-L-alanine--D-glutamate ligase [Anaerolineales bacterium]